MEWKFARGDELAPGRRVTARLGGGERYEAYLAWNEELLCPTVVKIVRPHLVDDDRARRAIATEAATLAQLDHPSFIRLFGADVEGPRPFVELEFLDGPRLSTLLRRHGILLPEQLFPLARQLASALHYLHGRGMVHLDVKPSNIIMGPVPRLIDLSVARRIETLPREDDPGIGALLRRGLGVAGFEVEVAPDLASAGNAWPAGEPDLVIVDVMLPDGDGIEMIERRRAAGDRCPVIVLTAREDEATRRHAAAAEVDAFMAKPFAYDELLRTVRRLAG